MKKLSLKKYALTLIEVCIAFGIIAVCFYIVFSNFNVSSKLVARTEKAQIVSLQRQYLSERLHTVFEHLEPLSIQEEEKDLNGETISVLSFVFENGLDREMVFSGIRRGEIELKQGGKVVLSVFSKEGSEVREEVLANDINSIEWDIDTKSVVQLTLTDKDNKSLSYAFILPRCEDNKVIIEEKE